MMRIRRGIRPAAERLSSPPGGLERVRSGARRLARIPGALHRLGESPIDLSGVEAALARIATASPLGATEGDRRAVPSVTGSRSLLDPEPPRPMRAGERGAAPPATRPPVPHAIEPAGLAAEQRAAPRGLTPGADFTAETFADPPAVRAERPAADELPGVGAASARQRDRAATEGGASSGSRIAATVSPRHRSPSGPPAVEPSVASARSGAALPAGALSELIDRWVTVDRPVAGRHVGRGPRRRDATDVMLPGIPSHQPSGSVVPGTGSDAAMAAEPPSPRPQRRDVTGVDPPSALPAVSLDVLELALDEIMLREAEAYGLGTVS